MWRRAGSAWDEGGFLPLPPPATAPAMKGDEGCMSREPGLPVTGSGASSPSSHRTRSRHRLPRPYPPPPPLPASDIAAAVTRVCSGPFGPGLGRSNPRCAPKGLIDRSARLRRVGSRPPPGRAQQRCKRGPPLAAVGLLKRLRARGSGSGSSPLPRTFKFGAAPIVPALPRRRRRRRRRRSESCQAADGRVASDVRGRPRPGRGIRKLARLPGLAGPAVGPGSAGSRNCPVRPAAVARRSACKRSFVRVHSDVWPLPALRNRALPIWFHDAWSPQR